MAAAETGDADLLGPCFVQIGKRIVMVDERGCACLLGFGLQAAQFAVSLNCKQVGPFPDLLAAEPFDLGRLAGHLSYLRRDVALEFPVVALADEVAGFAQVFHLPKGTGKRYRSRDIYG